VSALDPKKIDELYRLPLAEFTPARNALAKTLSKDDAKLVKALAKPTVVPWAVNQVYWRARATYDRLMKSGEKLRSAQIAALEGRAADVRAASETHRRAIGEAVAEAERLAGASGAKPGADALARTFESLSLATSAPGQPGRLTDALQPAGFEALAGLGDLKLGTENSELGTQKSALKKSALKQSDLKPRKLELAPASVARGIPNAETRAEPRTTNAERQATAAAKAAAKAAEKEAARVAAEQLKHQAAVKGAEAHLERVQTAERTARETWERAHDDLLAARQALTDLRRSRFRSS
jgi:hypothetical protein